MNANPVRSHVMNPAASADPRAPSPFTFWKDDDIDLTAIRSRRVAIIGYGNQGHAHGLNLRDNGVQVIVGAREGGSAEARARADGFEVYALADAARLADVVMMLLPDEVHPIVFEQHIKAGLNKGDVLAFGHGLCVHFGYVVPPPGVSAMLIAPKGPGAALRARFLEGSGLPCIIAALEGPDSPAFALALSYAGAIGGGRVGVMQTTFREECIADLFGEQTVLCGGMIELVRQAFTILTEEGRVAPHMAYFDVLREVKLIADLIYARGISGMAEAISDTAEFGAYRVGPSVIGEEARTAMRAALADIESGAFARAWMAEAANGKRAFLATRKAHRDHPIEAAWAQLCGLVGDRS
jgi:ketol-acid reductoisomerase